MRLLLAMMIAATAPLIAAVAGDSVMDRKGTVRPEGSVARPEGGVQAQELDAAWEKYEQEVFSSVKDLEKLLEHKFDEAAGLGDLEAAEAWQAAKDAFRQEGWLPSDESVNSEVAKLRRSLEQAAGPLGEAYAATCVRLTREKRLTDARAVRDEWSRLEADRSLAAGMRRVYLSDLKPKKIDSGGPFANAGFFPPDGEGRSRRIIVGGKPWLKGLSLPAKHHKRDLAKGISFVSYEVPENARVLVGLAAIDDAASADGKPRVASPLNFAVIGVTGTTARALWESRQPLQEAGSSVPVRLLLKGEDEIWLAVRAQGDASGGGSVWLDPHFEVQMSDEPRPESP